MILHALKLILEQICNNSYYASKEIALNSPVPVDSHNTRGSYKCVVSLCQLLNSKKGEKEKLRNGIKRIITSSAL